MTTYVLWDCDGTLVDSEVLAMQVAVRTLAECCEGRELVAGKTNDDLVRHWAGLQFGQMIDLATNAIGPVDETQRAGLLDRNRVLTLTALKAVRPIPGVEAAVHRVEAAGGVNAVVTSSALDRVLLCLDATGLRHYFRDGRGTKERIFSAHDSLEVATPKPNPAIYHHAIERLGIGPEDCVVAVEDSGHGVRAAFEAGIPTVLGFVGGSHIPNTSRLAHGQALLAAGATEIVGSEDLPLRIRNLMDVATLTASRDSLTGLSLEGTPKGN